MKSTVAPRAAAILDFLAVYESRGNYLAYYGHGDNLAPLPATLGDVLQFQNDLVRVRKLASSATGRYQFMPTTLRDLMATHKIAPSTPFTPDFQDVLACALLEKRGYSKWTAGAISTETFADNLSMEWASLPYRTGKSYYDGDGLNHALVSRDKFMAALLNASKLSNAAGTASKAPAPPIAGTNPLSEILGQASKAITDIVQPPAGPSPGVVAPQPVTDEGLSMLKMILGTLLAPNMSTLSTVIQIGSHIPDIVEGVSDVVPMAKKAYADFEELFADVQGKGTQAGGVSDDIQAISGDVTTIVQRIETIWGNSGLDPHKVSDAAAKVPTLPAVGAIETIKSILHI